MSTKQFTIHSKYVLSAFDNQGERVYYAFDAHSGGYPYWAKNFNGAAVFTELEKIPTIGPSDYMHKRMSRIEILEVKYIARVVESIELVSEVKAKAMAEIEKIQKELARKISELEGM